MSMDPEVSWTNPNVPETPGISVVFTIIGILGLVVSVFLFLKGLDADVKGDVLAAALFPGIFGSITCFAISYALAKLHQIAFYAKAAHLRTIIQPSVQPTPPIAPDEVG